MATTQITKRFRPNAIGTQDNWILKSGANKVSAVDPGEPINHDDSGSRLVAVPAVKQSYSIDREFQEQMGTINELRVHCRHDPILSVNDSVKLGVQLTTTSWTVSSGLTHGGSNYGDSSVAMSRPGGGSWTEADLRDTTFNFSVENDAAEASAVTSLWVEVDYLPTDESGGAIPPEFPARKLRRSHIPSGILEAELRADALDIDLMDDFEVVHSQGPHPSGNGWVDTNPRKLRCIRSDLELNTMKVSMEAIDLHDYAAMFWHTGISPYNVRSDERYPDGPAVLHPGATETFERSIGVKGTQYKAWIIDASDSVAELSSSKMRIGPNGLLIEGSNTNQLVNSAFFDGFTNWTRSSTTLTTLDADTLFFYDNVATGFSGTNQTLKLTGSTSAIASNVIFTTVAAYPALNGGETFNVGCYHKDNSTHAPAIRIHSTEISLDWNAGTTGWDQPVVLNRLQSSTSNWEFENIVAVFTTSASVWPEVGLYAPTTDYTNIGNTQVTYQLGLGSASASSPIPTMSSAVGIGAETLNYTSNTGRRLLSEKAGTLLARIRFPYGVSLGGLGGVTTGIETGLSIASVYYDSNNWLTLTYSGIWASSTGGTGDIGFCINAAGVRQTAFLPTTVLDVSSGTFYNIAARWTSTDGELGLPSRTLSIFGDGVKGVDAQQTTDMAPTTSAKLYLGNSSSFTTLLNYRAIELSHIEILPFALSSAEINARP